MKRKSTHIVYQSQVWLLTLGLLVGFLSLTFGLGSMGHTPAQDSEGNQNPKVEIVKSIDAITTSFHVNLDYQYFILEVLPEVPAEDEKEAETDESQTFTSKAIKVLLRRIISPNAP